MKFKAREIASLIVVALVIVALGSSLYFKKPDNIVEETSEELIESLTGVEIDVTPNSPEDPICKKDEVEKIDGSP